MKKIVALFLAVIMLLSSAALAEGMTAGTYQASAQGYHGSIVLKVTVDADKITGIEVVEQSETEGIGAAALPMLVAQFLSLLYNIVDRIYIGNMLDEMDKLL